VLRAGCELRDTPFITPVGRNGDRGPSAAEGARIGRAVSQRAQTGRSTVELLRDLLEGLGRFVAEQEDDPHEAPSNDLDAAYDFARRAGPTADDSVHLP
jgi:hypothetical protein